jgi:hypothetical protein
MPFQIKTLFNDPTPDGYIHARYVIPMLKIAQDHTDFSEEELHEFVRHMMLVAKKMAATWRHLEKYGQVEDALVEAEETNPPLEKLDIQHIVCSQDLFLEVDEFLVQLKSTLDYLAKLPLAIIGKSNWPYLRTFGDKGQAILKALKNNVPKKWSKQVTMLEEVVLDQHRPWIELAIASRDRSNHFKDGGADAEVFIVAKMTIEGEEKIVVPMWFDNLTVRVYLQQTWHNLMGFVQQFTIGFLAMGFKEGLGYVHIPKPLGSLISPIVVLPDNAVSPVIQIMSLLQRKSQQDGTVSNPTVSGL